MSKLFSGLFPAALLGVLVILSGCGQGSGGGGADGSTSLRNSEAALAFRRDTQPPSIPTDLSARAVSSAQVELAWTASTDNRGVTGYRVRRNGALVATVGRVTTYDDIKLTASTTYSYTVRAVDAAGNVSGLSNVASATTQATDTTPPTVSSTSPVNAALDVAVNSAITATFSEVMLKSSLNATTFQLITQGGLPVAGTVSATSSSMTFTPSVPLDALAQYTATVTTGVEDSAGNPLAGNFIWSFTTGPVPDTTPPTVSAVSPADAATGVALDSAISATFSEAMTNSTLTNTTFILTQTSGGGVVGGRVSIGGDTATLVPSVALIAGTNYTATITTGVQDAAGNPLAANLAWTFTTAVALDTTPPAVSATSPANNATDVALDAPISATFSEPMMNATLNPASFTVATSGGAPVAGTVNISGNTATFTPSAPLAASTQYSATITTAASDAAGNALAADFTWFFTTGLGAPPPTGVASGPGYTTNFSLTENPISEGGHWVNTVSATWNAPVSTVGGSPGHAVGLNSSAFNDSIAMLTGSFTPDQKVTATAFRGGASGPSEIELHLRMTMVPGAAGDPDRVFTYEIDVVPSLSAIFIVRWNGPQGMYTVLETGSIAGVNDGDIIDATVTGPGNAAVITVNRNGAPVVSTTDTAGYASGNPGMGFDAGNPADGANLGFKSYTATSLGP
jgi:chitodextrinase